MSDSGVPQLLIVVNRDYGFRWYSLDEVGTNKTSYFYAKKRNFFQLPFSVVQLFLSQYRYDVIVVQGVVLEVLILQILGLRRRQNVKWILVELGFKNPLKGLKTFFLRKYLSAFVLVQTFTESLKEYLIDISCEREKFFSLPCTYSYTDDEMPAFKSTSVDEYDLISAGRTGRDFEFFEREVGPLGLQALVVGDVDRTSKYENVKFIKELPYDALINQILNCKVLVISLAQSKFPLGIRFIFLAMRLKVFVVFTDIPGNQDYFSDHQYRHLITFKNESGGLRSLILGLCNEDIARVVEYNHQYVETRFSPDLYVSEFKSRVKALAVDL